MISASSSYITECVDRVANATLLSISRGWRLFACNAEKCVCGSAESSEQSVVPHLTCTTPPSCRVHCWCVWTVAHSGEQCSPACMHSLHWSHQHSMTATRRTATRLRLDWTEAGPTLPHSTLVHVQVTECSTATDTHAAGAQDGSQSALTAGPNPTHVDPTQHTNTSSGLRLQCALMRGARVQDSTTAIMSWWQRGQRPSTQSFTIDPLPRPSASTTPFPTAQLPEALTH